MKTIINRWKLPIIILGFLPWLFFSCEKDSSNGNATMKAHLTDAPAIYDAVNIDVQQVNVQTDEKGWQNLAMIDAGVYNLLDFNNGTDVLVAKGDLPAGHMSQMRLVLGTDNSVVVNGVSFPLTIPSGSESGLKFNIQENLVAGLEYDVWIDFDAGQSILLNGNGTYSLTPVIRAYTATSSGAISGTVSPTSANPYITATIGSTVYSTYSEPSGYFLISGAPAGTYTVRFTASGYQTVVLNNVSVTVGHVTQVGTITMVP